MSTLESSDNVEETAILTYLSSSEDATISDTFPWSMAEQQNCGGGRGGPLDHLKVIGAVKSLSAEAYVTTTDLATSFYELTDEGVAVLQNGSQEILVLKTLCQAARLQETEDRQESFMLSLPDLERAVGKDVAKIGMGNCMRSKWIQKVSAPDGTTTLLKACKSLDDVQDEAQLHLQELQAAGFAVDAMDAAKTAALKRRKLIVLKTRKSFHVVRGPSYAPQRVRRAADLTKEMLDSGDWQTTSFKPYNFNTMGEKVAGGYLHPLLKVRAEFRKILMQMGFDEMPTNKYVESSFWNFDSLFQPQSHPARDAHDTFFIKYPAATLQVPDDYYERVKTMHEHGGAGSIGYRYDFQRGEAMKNLLRTHTTAVSSQMLYKLANQQPGGFQPARYFSIDRVFRNETMDATHLCEFHQVEGLVADYDLSLGDLIGTIETFFKKIGITQLRFKPAFNPYTEPSMEIFGYHPDLKKWTEIGNSGMFRPEMLQPMGLPDNVRVIAWGLSLERPTMIKYRIKNIRDLFGHKVDINRTRTAPVCRFSSSSSATAAAAAVSNDNSD